MRKLSIKKINITIDELVDKFKEYNNNEEDITLIRKPYDYAEKKHFGQMRITGDDYILHPLNVALILTEIAADSQCMAAALLHDTIEDSDSTKEEIESLVDRKINLEISEFSKLTNNITDIKNNNKSNYEQLYLNIKDKIDSYYNSNQLNEKSYNICIQILNDIFNFYIGGYPNIPDEYLCREED